MRLSILPITILLTIGGFFASKVILAAPGGIPGPPNDGEEESGNNLSTPVLWSDGVAKVLREAEGGPEDVLYDGGTYYACTDFPGVTCYLQQDPQNIWQAESWDVKTAAETSYDNGTPGPITGFMVDEVDWGDNLEARDWNDNSVVRVETVLWQMLGGTPRSDGTPNNYVSTPLPQMWAYQMSYLYGQGPSEMWGTTTVPFLSNEATVYSHCARLTIQKIAELSDPGPYVLTWDPVTTQWNGVSEPSFSAAVWQAGDGPGFYSAEINVPGRAIYGYNWDVKSKGEGDGVYRLTFSLDSICGNTTLNTSLVNAIIREPVEGEELEQEEPGGGTAVVDSAYNLTYIDVKILPRSDGGGAGGGGGGHGGGNGHGNGGPNH